MQTTRESSPFGPTQLLAGLAGIPYILLKSLTTRAAEQDGPHPHESGRPVEQIAHDLGVSPEQFRQAFKLLQPASPGQRPSAEQRCANRRMLADALAVSLERLNEVMDKHRPIDRGDTNPPAPHAASSRMGDIVRPSPTLTSGTGSQPVEQIARELGVTPEAFREAFKKVRPATAGQRPSDELRRSNRLILSATLGVSLDRLNVVMDKFRNRGGDSKPSPADRWTNSGN